VPVSTPTPEAGDDAEDLLDFSFASLPTRTPEESAARRALRAEQSAAASHAYRCAELDGRDPIESARAAASKAGAA
jgi:hypothetical protein